MDGCHQVQLAHGDCGEGLEGKSASRDSSRGTPAEQERRSMADIEAPLGAGGTLYAQITRPKY